MRRLLATEHGQALPPATTDDRADVRIHQTQPRVPTVPKTRQIRGAVGVAVRGRDVQPDAAAQPPDPARHRL